MNRKRSAQPAWWSESGPEYCEFCRHGFHLEVGYYCIECDRPVCPVCVVSVRRRETLFCPKCAPERVE